MWRSLLRIGLLHDVLRDAFLRSAGLQHGLHQLSTNDLLHQLPSLDNLLHHLLRLRITRCHQDLTSRVHGSDRWLWLLQYLHNSLPQGATLQPHQLLAGSEQDLLSISGVQHLVHHSSTLLLGDKLLLRDKLLLNSNPLRAAKGCGVLR